jgi:hypothetical protein
MLNEPGVSEGRTSTLSSSCYCTWLRNGGPSDWVETEEEISKEKFEMLRSDTFAMELAFRLAVADISQILCESFGSCYGRLASNDTDGVGVFWICLTLVCLEDKTYGEGRRSSILYHPVVDEYPALKDIGKLRGDADTVVTAKRFHAAFETMNGFNASKARNQGVSSFGRHLGGISDPDDLWVVLAGFNRLVPKSSLQESQKLWSPQRAF